MLWFLTTPYFYLPYLGISGLTTTFIMPMNMVGVLDIWKKKNKDSIDVAKKLMLSMVRMTVVPILLGLSWPLIAVLAIKEKKDDSDDFLDDLN